MYWPDIEPTAAQNIGYVKVGEWLQYTIGVLDAGTYAVDISTSVNIGSPGFYCWMAVSMDDEKSAAIGPVPDNLDWQTYRWVFDAYPQLSDLQPKYKLAEGVHKFKYYFDDTAHAEGTDGFNNLAAFRFTRIGD
jgi:hypothetical protein